MRALKAILTAAGELKRKIDEKEDILALIALMDVNLPKFTLNDIPLFKSITSDLFPGVKMPDREYTQLLTSINSVCSDRNWIP
jgi:dynein heavy chain